MEAVILLAIPFFILAMLLEYYLGKKRQVKYYQLHDTLTNLSIGIGNQALGAFITLLLVSVYVWIHQHWSWFPETLTWSWWAFPLCLVLFDFLYYWAHRWSHEWNFLWAAHVVHHQSEEYNLSVALRQSWFHNLLAFFIFLPLPFLGFEPEMFFLVAGLATLYQFWIHTKAIDRMPAWFEFLFNTPSHHRVHHAVNLKYLDRNHGAVFIVWDRLFGTFQAEEEEPSYGITTPLKTWNPTWANLHYFVEMFNLAKHSSRLRDRLRVWWARPGWRPKELGGPLALSEPPAHRAKYQTELAPSLELYALLQFLAVLLGLVAYLHHFEGLTWFYKLYFLGLIWLSLMICTAILEKRTWVKFGEYARLTMILLGLNVLYYFHYLDWFKLMVLGSSLGVGLSLWYFRRYGSVLLEA